MKCQNCKHKKEKHNPKCSAIKAGAGWVQFCSCEEYVPEKGE